MPRSSLHLLTLIALCTAVADPDTAIAQQEPLFDSGSTTGPAEPFYNSGSTTGPADSFYNSGSTTGRSDTFNFDDPDMADDFAEWENGGEDDWQNEFRPGEAPAADEDLIAFVIAAYGTIIAFAVLATLMIYAVVCFLIASPLSAVPEEYRAISPGQVWLLMIPCFNIIWAFFVGQRVPQSFQNYFQSTGNTRFGDCGAQIGLWWAICIIGSAIPCLNYAAGPAQLVLLIIFIVKLWGMKGEIDRRDAIGDDPRLEDG